MKKNITINLYGTLYAIDEDACMLLEKYIDNMKAYFAKRDGGDEIADDIEHRVAEILSDLKANGTEAISIEHVQDIIHRIGNPEEMDEESADDGSLPNEEAAANADTAEADTAEADTLGGTTPPEPPAQPSGDEAKKRKGFFTERKLYRDADDRIIGGVMSGLCKYFGATDPLPWRIICVLLCLVSFSTMGIVYLLAWAIIPQANTAEERLLMQGRPVNPATLNEELMKQAEAARNYVSSSQFQRTAHSVAGTFGRIVLFLIQLFFLALSTGALIGLLTFAAFLLFYPMCAMPADADEEWIMLMQTVPAVQWGIWGATAFGTAFLCIVIYALLRWMFKPTHRSSMSAVQRFTLFIIAIISFAAALSCTIATTVRIKQESNTYKIKKNSAGGYFLWNDQRDDLEIEGWNILAYEHCNPEGYCLYRTENWTPRNCRSSNDSDDYDDDYDDDNDDVRYLYFEHDTQSPQPMKVHFTSTYNKPAGYYRLAVVGRTNGDQTLAYATTDGTNYATAYVPEGTHGNLRDKSAEEMERLGLLTDSAWKYNERGLKKLVDKWSYAESDVFYHKGGTLKVGFTNRPELIGQTSPNGRATSRFSIRLVKLVPVAAPTIAAPHGSTPAVTPKPVHPTPKSPSKK